MDFALGQLAPDQGEFTGGVVMAANNVLPRLKGYGPLPSVSVPASATALPDPAKGIISLILRDGTNKVFGATSSDWFEVDNAFVWSSLGGAFSLPAGDFWSFEHFGSFLLGTNTTDGLNAYNVEAPAGFTVISDAGAPRHIFTCANVMVGLDCIDNGGSRDNKLIRNSALSDHTNWKSRGGDYQPLEDGGALIAGADVTGNGAVILQEQCIRIMQFGNAPNGALFSLSKQVEGIGPRGAVGVVTLGGRTYFPSPDGFVRYPFGASDVERIGAGFIDDWFLGRVDLTALGATQGAIDPTNRMIWWRYKSLSVSSDDVFEDMLGYSPQWNKWVTASINTQFLTRLRTPGYTLDGMDDFGPLDGIDILLDDRFWQGGQPTFAVIDSDGKIGTLSGSNLAATIRTATTFMGGNTLIGWATPIGGPSSLALSLGVKDDVSDALAWKAAQAKASSGRVALRGRGSNVALEIGIPAAAEWTQVEAVTQVLPATDGGVR